MKFIFAGAVAGIGLGILILVADASGKTNEALMVMAAIVVPIFAVIGVLGGWFCLTLHKMLFQQNPMDQQDVRPQEPRSPGVAVAIGLLGGLAGAAFLYNAIMTAPDSGYLVGALVGCIIGTIMQIHFVLRRHEEARLKWQQELAAWEERQERIAGNKRNMDRGLSIS